MNFRKLVTLGMTLSVLGANIAAPAVYAAELDVEEAPAVESVVEEAAPAAEEATEEAAPEAEAEEVAIEDEATPLAGEVAEEKVDIQEAETTEESDEAEADKESEETEVDAEKEELVDEAEDEKECNHIDADEDGICDECGDELGTKDADEAAKKIKAGTVVSVKYHLNDDNTVIKITKTSVTDDNGNTTVEETEEEIGFLDEDGNLNITHTEINEVDICHVNISYDKEIEIVDNFTPTGEFVDTNLIANYDIEAGSTITEETVEENKDAISILAGINLPENLESGIDITAHIDADGNVSDITAVATDAEHQEIEVEVSEIVEVDFEFDVEYSEDDLETLTIEDEEVALAGDTESENESDAEDEESDTETEEESETTKEVSDAVKEDEIVSDEPSDEVAEEVTTEEIIGEVIDVVVDGAPTEEVSTGDAPADNSSEDTADAE